MKFHEKLQSLRKKQGLSQEELGFELQVSRQTISKWEVGQSYPDFQRLVMLSDYFDMTLDELIKDIDVQDVREKSLTDEKVSSLFADVEKTKSVMS
ncbi:MAG: helix-turn-helix domain-containing protein, partial [Butyricicoccus sp.]